MTLKETSTQGGSLGSVDVASLPGTVEVDIASTAASLDTLDNAVATDGAAIPTQALMIAGSDGADAYNVSVDVNGRINTNIVDPLPAGTNNIGDVDVVSSVLPTGAATEAKQDAEIALLTTIDADTSALAGTVAGSELQVDVVSSALPLGAATEAKQDAEIALLTTIDADTSALAGTVSGSELQVDIVAPLPAGNNNIGDVDIASSALPTGASTLAEQQAQTALLTTIDADTSALAGTVAGSELQVDIVAALPAGTNNIGDVDVTNLPVTVDTNFGAVGASTLRSAAQIGNATGAADFGSGVLGAQTLRTVLATDQPAIDTNAPVNAAGDSPGSSTVSTVATITAPANAVGFNLMNLETSTANIRWRIGAAATAASGQQLQPGRDTGYIPCSANISICAESGTQNYDVQFVLSS